MTETTTEVLVPIEELHELKAWRDAVLDACAVSCVAVFADDTPADVLKRLLSWEQQIALDPRVSAQAAALRDSGKVETAEERADRQHDREDAELLRWLAPRIETLTLYQATGPDESAVHRTHLNYPSVAAIHRLRNK
jgi:hypothetical protein